MGRSFKNKEEFTWSLYFGRNLQRTLHIYNMTQEELAKRLGVTQATISRYVCGLTTPSIYKVCLISQVIGCDISDLVKSTYED